jgi:hypothetical protein
MDNNSKKSPDNDSSSESTLDRGNKAIEVDEQINKKDLDKSQLKKEKEKDAEQWRNEG